MIESATDFLRKALVAPPVDLAPQRTRVGESIVGLVAACVGGWVLIYKVECFIGLETTSDMYIFIQLATSWFRGEFLQDNCFGNQLATHTFLLSPLVGLAVRPYGAYGLFVLLSAAAAAGFVACVKILRLLRVPSHAALGLAVLVTAMPVAAHVYEDSVYAYHEELLEPALALWLTNFLLRRHWAASLGTALLLILAKEDAPVLVALVATMVAGEEWFGSARAPVRARLNRPAVVVLAFALLSIPVLLLVIKSQQVPGTPSNLSRLKPVGAEAITSNVGLLVYVATHLGDWLFSPKVIAWLGLALAGTFGLIVVRPHWLVLGVATTLISWLVQDDLLWAPRFAPSLAFFQIVACLAFASVWGIAAEIRTTVWRPGLVAAVLGVAAVGLVVLGMRRQLAAVPLTAEFYRLAPHLSISESDRRKADQLFDIYRRDGRRDEPVVASDYLFRYAHDRNLMWFSRLRDKPKPVWILWDLNGQPLSLLEQYLRADSASSVKDYDLVGAADRFVLLKRRPGLN